MANVYLDTALADFSGSLAIDEAYDGPFWVLAVVDNRRHNRLAFQVLDHDPTQDPVRSFLHEFQGQLGPRGWAVRGLPTDGSSLYPTVLEELWPGVRHPVCEFHVRKEITQAVLHAVPQGVGTEAVAAIATRDAPVAVVACPHGGGLSAV